MMEYKKTGAETVVSVAVFFCLYPMCRKTPCYSCKYHVVWCPKYRRKVLTNGVDVRLKELLLEYAANLSVDILEMEIMPDHVHILMEVVPQFGIHKAVKSLKDILLKY